MSAIPTPVSPFTAMMNFGPFALGLTPAINLPRVTAPQTLLDTVLHAMRSVTDRGDTANAAEADATSQAAAQSERNDGGAEEFENSKPTPFAASADISMEELIREHADAVYRVALSVTRDPVLAEDASQDALIKAWQALPSFRGESPLRNWILRIAHNTAISLLRKRRDELRDPAMLPERESHFSVESQVQDRIAIQRFEQALEGLDSVSRSIVVLREVEGLTYSELCDVLDLPMPTIKTRLLRARRQLANALDGWQP